MAIEVVRHLPLPEPPDDPKQLGRWIRTALYPAILAAFDRHIHAFPESAQGQVRVKAYTDTPNTKPTAANAGTGAIIVVTDGGAGAVFRGSDGTSYLNLG